jgi:hypothetical protein
MSLFRLVTFSLIILMACSFPCKAQRDSAIESLKQLPLQYIDQLDNKIEKYSHRISSKTEKTLQRLSKWEQKIKKLLERTSPETAARLFNNQTTFATLLQKIQEGKSIAENYQAKYDSYRDNLRTNINYLQQQKDNIKSKLITPVTEASKKLATLEDNIKNSEALEQFIKERKQLLITQTIQYIGKNKYLQKISEENFYYIGTLKNYRELFQDKRKAEQTALAILNRIPAFTRFIEQNSMLSQLFGLPANYGSTQSLQGLQTRSAVQGAIQTAITNGGPNAQEIIGKNMQQAQAELNKLKDKVIQAGGGTSSEIEIPDFKPKNQRSKLFFQRLEYGGNYQFQKNNSYLPTIADLALTIAYKLSDKKTVGLGASYKVGFGNDISNIKINNQGIGLRSFLDVKLKRSFWITGGYEQNYLPQLLQAAAPAWQQSGLLGLTKKIKAGKKTSNVQLLWDFLSYRQLQKTPAVKFRVGYTF